MMYLGRKPTKLDLLEKPVLLVGEDNHANRLLKAIENFGPWDLNREREFEKIVLIPFFHKNIDLKKANKVFEGIIDIGNYKKPSLAKLFEVEVEVVDEKYVFESDLDNQIDQIRVEYINKRGVENIILVFSNDHRLAPPTPIYYYSKKEFLRDGYPVQHVSMNKNYSQLFNQRVVNYALRNLQLQIYVKAGGIPWVLKQRLKFPSLIVGLGFSRLINKPGYVFATLALFESNGRWAYITQSDPFLAESRTKGMYMPPEIARKIFRDALVDYKRVGSEEEIFVSVHKKGPFSKEEAEAISNVLDGLGCHYELLEVTDLKLRLGIFNSTNVTPLQQYSWIQLNDYSGLLINTIEDNRSIGMPVTLYIKRHKKSSPNIQSSVPIRSSAQLISDMSLMGWREFFASGFKLPASLSMPHKAAKLIANGVIPSDRLRTRPWFI